MFPFVSVFPSQRIVLRRWHRRRSKRNPDVDEVGFPKVLHSISYTTTTHQRLQQIIFYVTFALLFTVSQGKKILGLYFRVKFLILTSLQPYSVHNENPIECVS